MWRDSSVLKNSWSFSIEHTTYLLVAVLLLKSLPVAESVQEYIYCSGKQIAQYASIIINMVLWIFDGID